MLKSGQKGTPGPIAKRKPTAFVLDDLHVLQTSKWSESLVKRLGLEKEENIGMASAIQKVQEDELATSRALPQTIKSLL